MSRTTTLAASLVIDYDDFGITIDGVDFPWYVAEGGPNVDAGDWSNPAVVHLPVLVWGSVQVRRDGKTSTYDRELGDVRAFARRLVRNGFIEAYPDLILKAEAAR